MSRVLTCLFLGLMTLLSPPCLAAEKVAVTGSETQYDTQILTRIGERTVPMSLTGAALRKRVIVKVYTIGSYLQEGMKFRSPEELAAADCPKMLHLVMERDVEGSEMADAFQTAIRANYASPAFTSELASLAETMKTIPLKRGDHVRLTHIPGMGLSCDIVGKKSFTVPGVTFSRAVWEIYLGRNHLGNDIKRGLMARLGS